MQPSSGKTRTPLTRLGMLLLLYTILAAFCYCFLHPTLLNAVNVYHMPGMGITITQYIGIGLMLLCANKQKALRHSAGGWFCLLCSMGLGACFALYANDWLRFLNLHLLLASTTLALYSLCGQFASDPLSANGLQEGVRRILPALFRHWGVPVQAMKGNRRLPKGLGLGLLLAVPVAIIILALLTSADSVFGGMLASLKQHVQPINGQFVWQLLKSVLMALMLFSLLFTAAQPPKALPLRKNLTLPPLTFTLALGALTVLYALFVYVQFRYLFGSAQIATMQGGYAQYARSGFFQLVIVACITLMLVLPALTICGVHKHLRILCGAVTLLTMTIVFSAFWRMRLYILEYGLTLLRVLTLWAIAMIFLALVLALVKCCRPGFQLCKPIACAILCTWVALNLCNVDLTCARYNVNAYNSGQLSHLDIFYLYQLSPDVHSALETIEDEAVRAMALERGIQHWQDTFPCAYDWSLSWRHITK